MATKIATKMRHAQGTRALWFVPASACVVSALVWFGLVDLAGPVLAAHGALMIAAWGVILPAGTLVARYGKVTSCQDFPRQADNPFWWNWHRALQYVGIAIGTIAFAVVVAHGVRFDTTHGRLGLAVLALGWGQVLSGWLRGTKGGPTDERANPVDPATWRGDHFDMTPRRLHFERWHKVAGWLAVALSALTIFLGLDLLGAPSWLLFLAGGLQGAAIMGFVDGVVRKRWVDTYAALWGRAFTDDATRNASAATRQDA